MSAGCESPAGVQVHMRVLDWLRLPGEPVDLDEDDPATTLARARTIQQKPLLRRLYLEHYTELAQATSDLSGGLRVELGSGGGFIKEIMPDVQTSDVLDLPGLDHRCSALDLPFGDETVRAFLMLHVFHHVGDAHRFLSELDRCLEPGGRVAMIEPAGTPLARRMYGTLHPEPCDPAAGWELAGDGPLTDANAALPWIVFQRDRERFEREFPRLRVRSYTNRRPFSPALTGGVSFRQLVPTMAWGGVRRLERLLSPLNDHIGMIAMIELEKAL